MSEPNSADLDAVDMKINKLLPELEFALEDSNRLVASFSGGWQRRMSLGKILLQVYSRIIFSIHDIKQTMLQISLDNLNCLMPPLRGTETAHGLNTTNC